MSKKWIACDIEDSFFGDSRKLHKHEKKKLQSKDRSKFKKTDQSKLFQKNTKPEEESLKAGKVLSITPQGFQVQHEGSLYACSLRGILKKEKTLQKNLVTVGDTVLFEILQGNEGAIAHVEPRKSVLSRADNLSRKKEQLIAANIDIVFIVSSVVVPTLKTTLIDRYIIAAEKGGMEPVVVINKIDLLDKPSSDAENERELLELLKRSYSQAGVKVLAVSTVTGAGIEELKQIMKDKTSVFSGQSGVGKTSIINRLLGSEYKIGTTVERTKKGSHTTTTTQLIPLEQGGFCIDTPGIKSFGVWNLQLEEIEAYFSEIHEMGLQCKFPDCTHTQEEDCAVIHAVENGDILPPRYLSYLSLRESVKENYLRR
ncbi:putative ribosome biogenesis GTPase RsgA [Chlamydiales bacterium STE3]|nr:putative ribosome biogenesis GTPase RsgA [Chlamydiales bacterium STE3]